MKTQTNRFKLAVITLGLLFVSAGSGVMLGKVAEESSSKSEKEPYKKIFEAGNQKELLQIGVLPIFFGTIEASLSGN
jgi:uncharacterized membrane protein